MNRDGHVHILPIHVANKIAAGEVVERPASVVKELVDNAIDAGAKTIKVCIADGGRKLVSVADDGIGMERDDALLSLERQATSKILDVGDIERIDTLGFRGEAIPSIASVSRFSMTTRRHDSEEGTSVKVDAGTLADVRTVGCPPGTLVEVRDLFCNVPARRKFLRAAATEENHIKRTFADHAMSRPDIGFSLTIDGRETYKLAPAGSVAERIREIIGAEAADNMLKVDSGEIDGVSVTGFIERPDLGSAGRREQYVFINGRAATAPQIAIALKEACPRRIMDSRPLAVIFVNVPNTMVDVNVHPSKREVRFRNGAAVKEAVRRAIAEATWPKTAAAPASPAAAAHVTRPDDTPCAPVAEIRKTPGAAPVQAAFDKTFDGDDFRTDEKTPLPWKRFKFLAQMECGVLIIETDDGLVMINPRAAKERIAYEKLAYRNGGADGANPSQTLLIPEIARLSPSDAGRIKAILPEMAKFGFSIEPFGQDTFKVDAIPQIAASVPPSTLLSTLAQDLADCPRRGREGWREDLVAKSVAKSFAGMQLSMDEQSATRLVEELARCRMPYISPRVKPVMILTSLREIDRKFAGNA